MYVSKIILTNFKSYSNETLEFNKGFNCIVGQNGVGKTNILDSLYYAGLCRGMYTNKDKHLCQHNAQFFRIETILKNNESTTNITAKVIPGKSKSIEKNSKAYRKIADHIGLIPIVCIHPFDTDLAMEGSESRRKFIDNTLSQVDPIYLRFLMQYNKIIHQKNTALKEMQKTRTVDNLLIEAYNLQLIEPAKYIHEKRKAAIASINTIFQSYYNILSTNKEQVSLRYKTQLLNIDFSTALSTAIDKDCLLGRSTFGPHKDDIVFEINAEKLKIFGSQGQLKSFIIALKLAQYTFLYNKEQKSPLLLLDDIFDKLDHERVAALTQLLKGDIFQQIFITDTDFSRIKKIMNTIGTPYSIFTIEDGKTTLHEAQ